MIQQVMKDQMITEVQKDKANEQQEKTTKHLKRKTGNSG